MDVSITDLIPVIAALLGAIVGGLVGYFTVKQTNKAAEEREERNRKEERQKTLREERKQVYIQFIKYVLKTDMIYGNQNRAPAIDEEKYVDGFTDALSALKLLSPKIADRIIAIYQKYQLEDDVKVREEWKKASRDMKNEVFPLMHAELSFESEQTR